MESASRPAVTPSSPATETCAFFRILYLLVGGLGGFFFLLFDIAYYTVSNKDGGKFSVFYNSIGGFKSKL
jgi:hypothetical protein